MYAPAPRRSDTVGTLMMSLAKAQASFGPIEKNCVARVKSDKANYEFKYADFSAVVDATRKPLNDNGIAITQHPETVDDAFCIATTLWCGEEFITTFFPVVFNGGNAQALGSSITYAKRYGMSAALDVSAEEDDDGNAGSGNTVEAFNNTGARSQGGTSRTSKPAKDPAAVAKTEAPWTYKGSDKPADFVKWMLSKIERAPDIRSLGKLEDDNKEFIKTLTGAEYQPVADAIAKATSSFDTQQAAE